MKVWQFPFKFKTRLATQRTTSPIRTIRQKRQHVKHARKSPAFRQTALKKSLIIGVSTAAFIGTSTAYAKSGNVFEPLLQVLLPFTKTKKNKEAETPKETDALNAEQNAEQAEDSTAGHAIIEGTLMAPTVTIIDTSGTPDTFTETTHSAVTDFDTQDMPDEPPPSVMDDGLDLDVATLDTGLDAADNEPKPTHAPKIAPTAQAPENPEDLNALFSELFGDELIAEDITPSSQTPELYALLEAEFAADRGEIAKALTLYKTEAFKKNATNVFERALELSIEFEKPADSLTFAAAWQRKNPEHIPAWFYVTHLALKAGEYRQAATMIATILRYDPSADLGQILTGIIPTNPNDQRELFIALQDLKEDNPSVAVLRAGLLMNLGEYKPALLHINQALKKQPKNLAFILLKTDILRADQRLDEVWAYLRSARKLLPKEKELYLQEIRHYIDAGELTKAWELINIANKNTGNADVTLLAGLVGLDSGRYQAAINVLKPLLNNPAFASQAHYYTAIGYERLGDTTHALRHYEQVRTYEHVLDASTKAVGFYLLNDNTDAAIKTLVRLRDEFPSFAADSYILQAEIYLRQGDKKHASDLLTIANRENPDDDRLLYVSLKLLDDSLSTEDKRHTINRLLEFDSLNPKYQFEDAKLRLQMNAQDRQAVATIRQISEIGIDNPDYDSQMQLEALLVLGDYALKNQDYQSVIDYLQAPYDVAPTLEAGILLLRAYQGLGDGQTVETLLKDLQAKFGGDLNNQNTNQIY